MKEVIKLKESIAETERKIKEGSLEYLKRVLRENSNSLNLDDDESIKDGYLTVPYDGGRHPEYASNEFSAVDSIYLKDDKVFLSIEETDEYEIDRINDDDLYAVAMFVYEKVLK